MCANRSNTTTRLYHPFDLADWCVTCVFDASYLDLSTRSPPNAVSLLLFRTWNQCHHLHRVITVRSICLFLSFGHLLAELIRSISRGDPAELFWFLYWFLFGCSSRRRYSTRTLVSWHFFLIIFFFHIGPALLSVEMSMPVSCNNLQNTTTKKWQLPRIETLFFFQPQQTFDSIKSYSLVAVLVSPSVQFFLHYLLLWLLIMITIIWVKKKKKERRISFLSPFSFVIFFSFALFGTVVVTV